MEGFALGVTCGVFAFLWCNVLTAHGMIFNFFPRWYWNAFAGKDWAEWLAKPLFDCPVCNSFWVFMMFYGLVFHGGGLVAFFHGVVAALFFAYALNRHYGEGD